MSGEKRPEWMTNLSALVDPNDYLLGRKIDKTFELAQQEKATRAKETRISLIAKDRLKLSGDPILDLERKKQALKAEIISNPMKLKQLREKLLREEREKSQTKRDISARHKTKSSSSAGSSRRRHK